MGWLDTCLDSCYCSFYVVLIHSLLTTKKKRHARGGGGGVWLCAWVVSGAGSCWSSTCYTGRISIRPWCANSGRCGQPYAQGLGGSCWKLEISVCLWRIMYCIGYGVWATRGTNTQKLVGTWSTSCKKKPRVAPLGTGLRQLRLIVVDCFGSGCRR